MVISAMHNDKHKISKKKAKAPEAKTIDEEQVKMKNVKKNLLEMLSIVKKYRDTANCFHFHEYVFIITETASTSPVPIFTFRH